MVTERARKKDALPVQVVDIQTKDTGINAVLAAAVVNHEFCQLLLDQPEVALQQGYLGDSFDLTSEEQALIVSIQTKSLPELARQIAKGLDR